MSARHARPRRRTLLGALLLTAAGLGVAAAPTPAAADTDCQPYLVAHHVVAGYLVGEDSCQASQGAAFADAAGHPWNQVDLAISGSAAGWVDPDTTASNFRQDMTDVPGQLFPQFGIPDWIPAHGTYSGASGTGISVLYPQGPAVWSGTVVLIMHGQANNPPLGTITPQPAGQGLPDTTFDNLYTDQFIDAGAAVIYVRRPAASGVTAITADNQHIPSSLNDNLSMGLDLLATGQRVLTAKLGRPATLTLGYGHSAGTIWSELLDESGVNTTPDGRHLISGFLWDDPGGGYPLALEMPQGQVLGDHGDRASFPPGSYLPQAARRQMVPGIVLAHALYTATHSWLPTVSYLSLKQQAQQLFNAQGLADKTRTYVIAGVSHIPASTGSPPHTLDYGPLVQALIPMLTNWVTRGTPPPPSIVGPPGDTSVRDQLQLPPIACPTGVRYAWPYPAGSATETGFVPYATGATLEPINSQGVLDDVDANGYRSALSSLDTAWRALHLIGPAQHVTTAAYVHCVTDAATALQREGLLTPAGAAQYIAQAHRFPDVP